MVATLKLKVNLSRAARSPLQYQYPKKMEKCKIIIIDDHQIVRDGIKTMLLGNPQIDVVGLGGNEEDLMTLLQEHSPHLIIMDLSLPGKSGIELTEYITINHPDIKVLILTTSSDEESIIASIEAGADGFLNKDTSLNELLSAIEQICNGEGYFSENITGIIYKSYINRIKRDKNYSPETQKNLTDREIDIIKVFSEGLTYKEIAARLNISVKTIETHKANILKKLELNNIIELVKYAIKNKIIRI